MATAIATISMILVTTVTWRLLKRSARNPPAMLNTTSGMKNNSVISDTRASRREPLRAAPSTMKVSR